MCRLRADARNTRDIVGCIAHQAQNFHHLFRPHTEFFFHSFRVIGFLLHCVNHSDTVVNQLHQILVSGNNGRAPAPPARLNCERPNDIIRLDSLLFQNTNGEGADNILNGRDLGNKIIRHGFTSRFVIVKFTMTRGRTLEIKCHNNVVRRKITQQLHQHGGEAINGVGGKPFGVGQGGNPVKGTINIIAAIHQGQQGWGIFFSHLIFYFDRMCVPVVAREKTGTQRF